MPALFEGRGADDTVRVWVPGCATGEEAYSHRHPAARAHGRAARTRPQVQIFATDIDEAALAVARAGRYPAALLAGTSRPSGCARFFTADGQTLRA